MPHTCSFERLIVELTELLEAAISQHGLQVKKIFKCWHMAGYFSRILEKKYYFFPTCQVRVVRFYKSCPSSPSSSSCPRPPPLCRHLCHHLRQLYVARCRSQWAAPDLRGELPSGVGSAGPHPGSAQAERAAPLTGQKKNVRRCVRKGRQKYVRRNVNRIIRRYVRKHVRKECQKIRQKECQKK